MELKIIFKKMAGKKFHKKYWGKNTTKGKSPPIISRHKFFKFAFNGLGE